MDTSLLARLPSEVRNEIWINVFISPFALKLENNALQHPLTRTCHQIRHETLAMFYSLTRFNAHLDEGPSTPLLNWLRKLNPAHAQIINEVNIWDLHNLNGTLHGEETTHALLKNGPKDVTKKFVLRRAEHWIFAQYGPKTFLKEIILALHCIGFGLLRFCLVDHQYVEHDDLDESSEETGGMSVSPTSSFALVPLASRPTGHIFGDSSTNIGWLAKECKLSESARVELIKELAKGEIMVQIVDELRKITFDFTSLELGGRVVDVASIEDREPAETAKKDRVDNLAQAKLMGERRDSKVDGPKSTDDRFEWLNLLGDDSFES